MGNKRRKKQVIKTRYNAVSSLVSLLANLVCFVTDEIVSLVQHAIMVIWGVPTGDSRGCCNQGNREKNIPAICK